jgi:hypothetical protein
MRTIWKRAMAVGTVSSLVMLGMVGPAQASSHQHSNSWGRGYVYTGHRAVLVCDQNANNRGLRIEYRYGPNNTPGHRGDDDGANGICKDASTSAAINEFRICESNTSGGGDQCTNWENIVGR